MYKCNKIDGKTIQAIVHRDSVTIRLVTFKKSYHEKYLVKRITGKTASGKSETVAVRRTGMN